jgi:zinc protease
MLRKLLMRVALCAFTAGLALFPSSSFAAEPAVAAKPAEPRKVVSIEGITEYALDNGLRVLLYPDTSSSRVTVNMTVLVGSRHEGYGETGMAHLLEHMLFKGTPTHPDVWKALRDHGAYPDIATTNGTTYFDRTNYYETLAASDANLEFAIRLEADRLVNSFIKREDLASEMTVVRNEFESNENSPGTVLLFRMLAAAYDWHNYAKVPIGNRSDIERVPIERLQAFYKKHYQSDNTVLIVAGNFDEQKALAHVARYFGALKKPARKLDATYTEEPAQDGERSVTLRRVGKAGVVGAMYHIPAASHEDFAAVEVLANILDPAPTGRLYKALVATRKATSVSAVPFGLHDPGVLRIEAHTASGEGLEDVRDILTRTVESLASDPVEKDEVERARAMLLKARAQLIKSSNAVGIGLSEWVACGDWRLFFLHRDRLEKVTPEDVARVAGKYLRRSNRTVGLYIPTNKADRTPVPEGPNVAALLKDYKGREAGAVAAGETFEPTPENIEKRVRRSELPGGVKLALLPKKSRGEAVTLMMTLRYGNAESLKGRTIAAELIGALMNRGTKKHNYQQLQDELDKPKLGLSAGGDTGVLTLDITCTRETLPRALELAREVLREPAFPQDEFDQLKRQLLAAMRHNLTEPGTLAPLALRRKLSPYPADDVRYLSSIDETIARLEKTTIDDVRAVYREQVGGTVGEVAVVGDFDAEAMAKAIGDILNGWKSATPYRRIEVTADTSVEGAKVVLQTPDKANAVYYAGLGLAMDDRHPDYPALVLGNSIFGGSSSRLFNRVRNKDGLSYGVGSGFSAGSRNKVAQFMMMAIANPTNMAKVEAAIAEELAKFLKDGATEKEVEDAKKGFLAELRNSTASDGAAASVLLTQLAAGRTSDWQIDFEKKIAGLTAEQVNTAFRKHVDPQRLVIVTAGDFKKK